MKRQGVIQYAHPETDRVAKCFNGESTVHTTEGSKKKSRAPVKTLDDLFLNTNNGGSKT